MAILDQVIAQIRFQIEQLSAQNGHHDFEHICRHLARARICSNILPATGPVSAGGDQGRDFETFRTYLSQDLNGTSGFLGLVSDVPISFACTLTQKDRIRAKIQDDVKSITSQGEPVKDIHYFCSCDIPVALKHKLKKWAKKNLKIFLELYDGLAISELLADREVFWIAEKWLSVPSEIYPPVPIGYSKKWYSDLLEYWKNNFSKLKNFADFSEIKPCIREATFNSKVKNDLTFWIDLLNRLKEITNSHKLKRLCTYEIAVAKLRGQKSLHGYEVELEEFFSEIVQSSDTNDLENTVILLTYCASANIIGEASLNSDKLSEWIEKITDIVDNELKQAISPGWRCNLLKIRGYMYLTFNFFNQGKHNFEHAIKCWSELLTLVDQAPLFPVEDLSDFFTIIIQLGIDNPDLDNIIDEVDSKLQKRAGGVIVADKCRDRALAYVNKGNLLKGINQLHTTKIKYFTAETLRGSLLSILLLSRIYSDLNLNFASKHYGLMAAYIGIHSDDINCLDLVTEGLKSATAADYKSGAFCGFLNLSESMLKAYSSFSKEEKGDSFDEINWTAFHITSLRSVSKIIQPNAISYIDFCCENLNISDFLSDLEPMSDEQWIDKDISQIKKAFEREKIGLPWNDLSEERTMKFRALGITWLFTWENSYEINFEAEAFLSAFQIVLATLGGKDLCLLRSEVETYLIFSEKREHSFEPKPSNEKIIWDLKLPLYHKKVKKNTDKQEWEEIIILAATSILEQVSTYDGKTFFEKIKPIFEDGVFEKAFFAVPYVRSFTFFVDKVKYDSIPFLRTAPFFHDFIKVYEHPQLRWIDGDGPFYTKEESYKMIHNRHKNIQVPIRITLSKLLQNQEFLELANDLKQEGWKDWHILLAIGNISTNYRINKKLTEQGKPFNPKEQYELTKRFMETEESEDLEPIPLNIFNRKSMKMNLETSMMATLTQWGHHIHQITPNIEAIIEFLSVRYHYWEDDIEHDKIF